MPNTKLLQISTDIINKIYNVIIQLMIEQYDIKNVKSAKVYKFQNKTAMNHEYHCINDLKINKCNIPVVLIDKLNEHIEHDNIKSLVKFYDDDQLYYLNDNSLLYMFDKNDIEVNSLRDEFSNKIYFENILRDIAIEVIDNNNKKYLCILDSICGLHVLSSTYSSVDVVSISQLYNEFVLNKSYNFNNSSPQSSYMLYHKGCYINEENSDMIDLFEKVTNCEQEIKDITNNLDYLKCEDFEDFMTQFQYYCGAMSYSCNITYKEIYSWNK